MMRRVTRRWVLAAPLAWAGAADSWTNWSDKQVLRMLTDSPWARRRRVNLEWRRREPEPPRAEDIPGATGPNMQRPGGGNPIGGIGVPRTSLPLEADLIIRWASALPVRQARALYLYRLQQKPVRTLNELLEDQPEQAILEIHGLPAQIAHRGAAMVELAAMQGVRLRGARGRTLAPVKARADLAGLTLDLYVHFDRGAAASLGSEIEVVADLQIAKFRERFRLSQMMYGGRLEM
ncbi:MAG: hypothetical protein KatS3mg004_3838 [Bryobacteraceae bacterium]|nr:MAG: hypothetical protein KatS3mg004_3838 [Bryobacteraceae bacterium]